MTRPDAADPLLTLPCDDCRQDTRPVDGRWEYYMIHNHLWQTYAADASILCIGCLETRAGRTLTASDFTDCLLTHYPWRPTERLATRLTARAVQLELDCTS